MSLSTSSEIKTTKLTLNVAAGGSDTIEIDATEDREIVGFRLGFNDVAVGGSIQASAELFTGVRPTQNPASIGKLYATHSMTADGTNGSVTETETSSADVPDDMAWDWNEDVVLTLRVNEKNGTNAASAYAEVYYREV